jgi:hypothetical protein
MFIAAAVSEVVSLRGWPLYLRYGGTQLEFMLLAVVMKAVTEGHLYLLEVNYKN